MPEPGAPDYPCDDFLNLIHINTSRRLVYAISYYVCIVIFLYASSSLLAFLGALAR